MKRKAKPSHYNPSIETSRSRRFHPLPRFGLPLAVALTLVAPAGAANFVVTTTADTIDEADGVVSLVEAVRMANQEPGPDTITFSDGSGGSVNFHDGTAETITLVLGEIDVCGPLTITGPGAEKLSISGGDASRIFDIAEDDTIITGLTFRNGKGVGGGAIFKDGGTLTMSNCVVKDSDAGIDSGGGIYVEAGALELTDSTVTGNKAGENGGGILAVRSDLILVRSVVEKNGALGDNGGGIFASDSDVSLRDSALGGNTARESGGGIYATGGTLTLLRSAVETNTTQITLTGVSFSGGGIVAKDTEVSLTDSAVSENSTTGRGGGISTTGGSLTLLRTWVEKNTGGGIETADTTVSLSDCFVNENTLDGGISALRGSVSLIRCRVEWNRAIDPDVVSHGGGIDASFEVELTVTDCVISNNQAGDDGGGIYAANGVVSVTRSTISNNRALGQTEIAGLGGGIRFSGSLTMTGCTISGNGGIDGGAGIHSTGASSAILTQCTISGNIARSPESTGGGIYANGGSVALAHCTINGNSANSGGGIYTEVVDLTLTNSIVANSGGLDIDLDGTALTLDGINIVQQGIIRAISDGTGQIITDPTHLLTADPLLGPLLPNGGPTKTHALLSGSPAIDAGDNSFAGGLADDQRGSGFGRIVKGKATSPSDIVDIGAYELQRLENFPSLSYADWRSQNFDAGQLADTSVSGDDADFDGDTLNTFLEYITAGDPFRPDPAHQPRIAEVDLGQGSRPAFVVRLSSQAVEQTVVVQRSPDLGRWSNVRMDGPALLLVQDQGAFADLWFDLGEASAKSYFFRLAVNPDSGNFPGTVTGTTEFTFDGFNPNGYGDRVAAAESGGFTYAGEPEFTPNIEATFSPASFWVSGYGDLLNVIYPGTGTLQIDLTADFGFAVRLEGFDLAGFGAAQVVSSIDITDGDGAVLWSQQDVSAPNPGHAHFDFTGIGVESNTLTILIASPSPSNIGFDNLRFQQVALGGLGDWSMLTFDTGLANGAVMNQGYGDRISGPSSGSFSYVGGGNFTPGIVADYAPAATAAHWTSGFGNLTNILYQKDAVGTPLDITLTADPGRTVQLFGFDMAAFRSGLSVNSVKVLDGFGRELFGETNLEISTRRTSFDFFSAPLEANQITIRLDPSNLGGASDEVGIDNIRFGEVPQ